jgi:hypothetical protein
MFMATLALSRKVSTATTRLIANSAVLCLVLVSQMEKAMAQNTMGPIFGNQGIITQGQTGNNTINVAPPRLAFDTGIGDQLVSKLPPDKTIVLQTVGNNADQAVASQYQQYLLSKGFQVERMSIGMMGPPPDHKITIGDTSAEKVVVIIAPSAN